MTKRLLRDLESSKGQPSISLTTLDLSTNDQPLEIQISEVTTQLDKLIQAHLRERKNLR